MAHSCRITKEFRFEGTFSTYLLKSLAQSKVNFEDRFDSEVRKRESLVQSILVCLQGRTWPVGQDKSLFPSAQHP